MRDYWFTLFAKYDSFDVTDKVDGKKMFEPLFAYAQGIVDGKNKYQEEASRKFVAETLAPYLSKGEKKFSQY